MIALATFHYTKCGLATQLALLKLRADESQTSATIAELAKQFDESRAAVKAAYEKAKAQVAGKKEAMSMLKDYYAHWQSAIDGLLPSSDEPAILYESRKQRASDELNRLGDRLALEVE
jgi:hypothetical protein